MSHYDELDRLIVAAIKNGRSPLYERHVYAEADRIGEATGRKHFRIIDGRIQALRRAGKIRHAAKSEDGIGGWRVQEKKS